jgi:hypothetical protein
METGAVDSEASHNTLIRNRGQKRYILTALNM